VDELVDEFAVALFAAPLTVPAVLPPPTLFCHDLAFSELM
jgi:hypothetical protein